MLLIDIMGHVIKLLNCKRWRLFKRLIVKERLFYKCVTLSLLQVYGPDHQSVASVINHLAMLYKKMVNTILTFVHSRGHDKNYNFEQTV